MSIVKLMQKQQRKQIILNLVLLQVTHKMLRASSGQWILRFFCLHGIVKFVDMFPVVGEVVHWYDIRIINLLTQSGWFETCPHHTFIKYIVQKNIFFYRGTKVLFTSMNNIYMKKKGV